MNHPPDTPVTPPPRIVLTHSYFLADDPKEQAIMKPYPPLGILYISAFLEKNGVANEASQICQLLKS